MVEEEEPHHLLLSSLCHLRFLRQESVSPSVWIYFLLQSLYFEHVCWSTVFLVVSGFCLYCILMDTVEQTDSHPLNIVLAHFKEVRARAPNLSVDVRKGKMISSEYLTFDVGWPREGELSSPHSVSSKRESVSKVFPLSPC